MTIDYAKARETMVEQQVRPWDVLDLRVLAALGTVPRDAFVPEAHRTLAYADLELPIGHGQSMMKPVVEGRMLQALDIDAGDEVLEIGTGSGFISACLGYLARDVLSLEVVAELADSARTRLAQHGHDNNVRVETADALAWETTRRFDAICVTAAVDTVPLRFIEWLRPGGRLFVVRGRAPVMDAVCLHNEVNGLRTESLFETELPYLAGAAPKPEFQL
ncbi:protein-L-isoaspartate(D-aspartate) O-methyltransferase [Luteimonas cucumeris]|uniref:Protein-L-isoaspartate O-methyltransferase n=1 Tax=Luteimonas cucumeris TaxID=985012 RepID=A0A562LES8_9GAMM|nr:protein-L-isoaspartate O-methyltransferase [Luteimonas cucumeris]TWI06117.1 protein-L-isoaspartate(D-aspartate) O-methyltransferase [Luteimonas cucumeris]